MNDDTCEPFGVGIRLAASTDRANWVFAPTASPPGTIGSVVPSQHTDVVRVAAPPPMRSWWQAYQRVFVDLARWGVAHTETPSSAFMFEAN